MRGKIVLPIPVPTAGLMAHLPPHQIPPTALSDGSNTYLDVDGLYKCRNGYSPVTSPGPSARITGGITYTDSNGTGETVCATLIDWFALINNVWTKITDPANLNSGSANNPTRFAAFAQGGIFYALGVNNVNPLRSWKGGDAAYTTPANAPVARDILVLSNRVVVFNVTAGGSQFVRRAQWSAFNDRTTWPILGFLDMLDSDDAIIGARKLGRQSAAVYGQKSIWVVQANPGGTDASAFTAEELFSAENYSGPIGTGAIVVAEGSHYYLGTDGRVYQFTGIQPQAISDPIDPKVIMLINFGFGSRCHAVYLPQKRGIIFFWPPMGQNDCTQASFFSLARQVWEPVWSFTEGITASWQATIVTALTWANSPYTWSNSPFRWQDKPNAQGQGVFIGTVAGQVHTFFQAFTDNGALIPYSAFSGLISPDPSQTFSLDRAEFYMRSTATHEIVIFQFDGFGAPLNPATPVVSIAADIGNDTWQNQMIEPGPFNPNNVESDYLRIKVFSGGSNGAFAFAGGNIYLNSSPKSDYGAN